MQQEPLHKLKKFQFFFFHHPATTQPWKPVMSSKRAHGATTRHSFSRSTCDRKFTLEKLNKHLRKSVCTSAPGRVARCSLFKTTDECLQNKWRLWSVSAYWLAICRPWTFIPALTFSCAASFSGVCTRTHARALQSEFTLQFSRLINYSPLHPPLCLRFVFPYLSEAPHSFNAFASFRCGAYSLGIQMNQYLLSHSPALLSSAISINKVE